MRQQGSPPAQGGPGSGRSNNPARDPTNTNEKRKRPKMPHERPAKKRATKQKRVTLFPKLKRTCIHCGKTSYPMVPKQGEPTVISVSMVVYYRPRGTAGQLRTTPNLALCEECTVRAVSGSPRAPRAESITLLNAVRERLAATYNAMVVANQQ
jgi:hypothetical protein